MVKSVSTIPTGRIEGAIFFIRGEKVMLDRDLAGLYQVPTSVFNQVIKRHQERFPEDFMFRLTAEEARAWLAENLARQSFKITECDLEARAEYQTPPLCIYRARHSDAIERFEE